MTGSAPRDWVAGVLALALGVLGCYLALADIRAHPGSYDVPWWILLLVAVMWLIVAGQILRPGAASRPAPRGPRRWSGLVFTPDVKSWLHRIAWGFAVLVFVPVVFSDFVPDRSAEGGAWQFAVDLVFAIFLWLLWVAICFRAVPRFFFGVGIRRDPTRRRSDAR